MRIAFIIFLSFLIQSCKSVPDKNDFEPSPEISQLSEHTLTAPFRKRADREDYYGGLYHLSCTDKMPDGTSYYAAFDIDDKPHDESAKKDEKSLTRADLAKMHYIHAAMANNVYRDPTNKPIFIIPGWRVLESFESSSGLGLELYGNAETEEESDQLVVAFRGTNPKDSGDWRSNLSLIYPKQYSQAYDYVSKKRIKSPTKKIIAVGHSLGGALAIDTAMKVADVDAVVFNTSPRFSTTTEYENNVTLIFEKGEFLNAVAGKLNQMRFSNRIYIGNYDFLNFRFYSFSPVQEHSIYQLARALILVAMTREVKGAKDLFVANISKDHAMCFDPKNCRYLYQ